MSLPAVLRATDPLVKLVSDRDEILVVEIYAVGVHLNVKVWGEIMHVHCHTVGGRVDTEHSDDRSLGVSRMLNVSYTKVISEMGHLPGVT